MAKSKWDTLSEDYLGSLSTAATRQSYRRCIASFTVWCSANSLKPLAATTEQVRRYLTVHLLDERRLALTTMNVHLFALQGVFNFAADQGVISQSPVHEGILPQSLRGRNHLTGVQVISRDSARLLLHQSRAAPAKDRVVVRLLLICGLLPGEVQALDVVDFKPGPRDSLLRVGDRQVVLDHETATAVEVLVGSRSHGALINNDWDRRLTRENINSILTRVAKQAGVDEPVTAQQLRNTAVVTAISEGAALSSIQGALGVKDLRHHYPVADRYRSDLTPAVLVASALAPDNDEVDSLLVQAQRLASDDGTHPAAGLVLAAATLERLLRQLAVQNRLPLPPVEAKATIEMLAGALRGGDIISTRTKKRIDAVAGARNDAAHGRFERVSRAGAIETVMSVRDLVEELSVKVEPEDELPINS